MTRGRTKARSAAEWTVRASLVAAALTIGYGSVVPSFGFAIRTRNVERARLAAPHDGRVTAAYAASLAGPDATRADRSRADRMARLALRQDPTAVAAVTTLGVNTYLRGRTVPAQRLLGYAQRLSRRELQTQVWAIEEAVARGDVAGAIYNYDVALRTSRNAPDLLFPVLASAIAEPGIRSALIRTLAQNPPWRSQLIDYIAGNGPEARSIADFFIGLARAGVAVSPTARRAAVDGLIESGQLDRAWAYYASFRPGAVRNRSRDPDFTADLAGPSLLDWRAADDVGITTSIDRGLFDFAASASVGGTLLQQMQMLPPGTYRLEGRSEDIDQPEESLPYWTLICQADQREFGRVVVRNTGQTAGTFSGTFTVPANCPAQLLRFAARPSDKVGGSTGRLTRARLVPAGADGRS